jgi:hypothetical protein
MTTLDYAKAYAAAGFSVIPVALDGSKKPVGSWKSFMSERASSRQIMAWFGMEKPYGIGLVHGAVSGNSCVIDIDDPQTARDYISLVQSVFPDLDLLTIDTPSDGLHLLFRYPENPERVELPGNLKLARIKDGKTRIETRGEGGYTIAPGSPESVHPSGLAYSGPHYADGHTFHEGDFVASIVVPIYDATTIDTLIALAKSFDESPEIQRQVERQYSQSRENSPGADYNARATNQTMLELLEKHGWQHHHTRGDGVIEITRPGKNVREGVSATIGHCGEGNLYVWSSNAPDFEPGRIYAPFTVYGRLEHASDFTSAARELGATGYGEQNNPPDRPRIAQDSPEASSATTPPSAPTKAKKETGPPAAENLVRWALEKFELWHGENKEPYATTKATPQVTYDILDTEFSNVLNHHYYSTLGKVVTPGQINTVIATLAARASQGIERRAYLRKATLPGAIYLDLGNESRRVVEVTAEGWKVVDESPVRFRRTDFTGSLPEPVSGGNLTELRKIVNLPQPLSMDDPDPLVLVVAWLLGALGPERPYTILGVSGEMGSAKSFLTKTLRLLVDPCRGSDVGMSRLPNKKEELPSLFDNNFSVCFDNCGHFEREISDLLCIASTSGSFPIRKLYSDKKLLKVDARRPIIMNGIADMTKYQDLADRMVRINMRTLGDGTYKDESVIEETFDYYLPRIFGALLDAIACGLKNFASTKLEKAPRMADFARWVTACEPSCPWKPGEFMAAYTENRQSVASASIEGNKVASYIESLCGVGEMDSGFATESNKPTPVKLEGSAGEIYNKIRELARKSGDHQEIPHGAHGMGRTLRELAPNLRKNGWRIPETRVLNGKTIWLLIPPGVEVEASEPTLETPAPAPRPAIGTRITMPAPTPGPGYVPPAVHIDGTDDDPFAE